MAVRRTRVAACLAMTLAVLCVGPLARVADAATATLSAVHWDDAHQRWRDIVGNPFVASKVDPLFYEGTPVVAVDYQAAGSAFAGSLFAQGLKPNFAYQIKLNGKPTKPSPDCPVGWGVGDDWANERIGYNGRWWLNTVNKATKAVTGAWSDDAAYEYWKNQPTPFEDTVNWYVFEGYLIFDYIVTDANGDASKGFCLDSTYHVLWRTSQRTPTSADSLPTYHDVIPANSPDWYPASPPSPSYGVGIFAEGQSGRSAPGTVTLPPGTYNVRIFLTEEDFHDTYYWTTVMTCDSVQFTIESAPPTPTKYWAVICGVADYKSINDLQFTDDDARDLAAALQRYPEWRGSDQIEVLIDSAASKSGVQNALVRMGQKANAVMGDHDVCLVFFSGHGMQVSDSSGDETDGADEAICAWDTAIKGRRVSGVITDDELGAWLSTSLPADADVVAIFDTCYSGGLAKGVQGATVKSVPNPFLPAKAKAKRGFGRGLLQKLAARGASAPAAGAKDIGGSNAVVLMACEEGKLSYETSALANGVFSYYVVEGLLGPADANHDRLIAAEEDFAYAAPRTTAYEPTQIPQLYDGTATEAILVHLLDNLPPTADAGPDQTVQDADGNGTETVTLDGTGSSDPDGQITLYEWWEGGAYLGGGATLAHAFAVGTHTVTLTVTDNGAAKASDTVTVTVNAAPQANIWGKITLGTADGSPLAGIQVKLLTNNGKRWVTAATTTTDAQGGYAFSGLQAGSYRVQPNNKKYTFSPASLDVTLTGPDDSEGHCDFVAN